MSMPTPADRLAAFLAEARQAIAVHGGLNPAALTRLRAAAQLHGLSAVQMSEALRSLDGAKAPVTLPTSQSTANTTAPPAAPVGILVRDTRKKSKATITVGGTPAEFPGYVAAELRKARVLWPPVYERLISDGERFDLEDIEAMDVIEQVGEKLAIPFVSASEAESRILSRAKDLHDRGELTPDANLRLREMAAQVGMAGPRYDAMVFQVTRQTEPASPPWLIAGLPGGAVIGGTLFVLLAAAATVGITVYGGPTERTVFEKPEEKTKPKVPTPTVTKSAAEWGPPELGERLKKAANDALPGLSDTWTQQLGSENAGVRSDGYKVLLESVSRTSPSGLDALALCFAVEPSAENAELLLAVLRRDLPPPGNVRPSAEAIDRWFAAAGLAARMLVAPGLPSDRAATVAKQLEYSLQVKPDPGASPAEFVTRVETLAAARIYHLVAELARTSPAEGARLAGACRARFERLFAPDVLSPLEANIAAAAAAFPDAIPDTDRIRVRTLFERVADSNTAARIRMAGVYQGLKPSPMRDLLEEVLLAKTGAKRGATPGETAANIRAKADVAAGMNPAPAADRAQELIALSRPLLAAPPTNEAVPLLQESLTLLHYSTLACALIGGPKPNEQRFVELLAKPTTLPKIIKGKYNPALGEITAEQELMLTRLLSSNDVVDRKRAFQKLTGGVEPDAMKPATTVALARYLTRVMDQNEIKGVDIELPKIAHSPALQLEFADQLLSASNDAKPTIEAALGHMLRQPTRLPDNRWKDVARRALLRRVIDGGLDDALNKGAEQYRLLLIEQGVLLGLDPAEFALRAEPSTIFEVLIRHVSGKLMRDKLSDADRRFLDQLPHYNVALDFQKLNDLQKTVQLQRVWLRVVCLYVAQQRPNSADRAAKLVDELRAEDAKFPDALARLRAGEAKLLQAWLLLVESP